LHNGGGGGKGEEGNGRVGKKRKTLKWGMVSAKNIRQCNQESKKGRTPYVVGEVKGKKTPYVLRKGRPRMEGKGLKHERENTRSQRNKSQGEPHKYRDNLGVEKRKRG